MIRRTPAGRKLTHSGNNSLLLPEMKTGRPSRMILNHRGAFSAGGNPEFDSFLAVHTQNTDGGSANICLSRDFKPFPDKVFVP